MNNKIDKIILKSFLEAFLAILIFAILYSGYNVEFIRSQVSDTAFSSLNKYLFANIEHHDKYNSDIQVYKIDKLYLDKHNLLDDYNLTNYGSSFPRSLLASFIKKMDSYSKHPLALFIDYNMENGYASYDINNTIKHISKDDLILLKTLAKKRDYYILLPKNSEHNFIQSYIKIEDNNISKRIKENINTGKITFVNVSILKSDNKIYRYKPIEKYRDSNKSYYNISLVTWQLLKNAKLNDTELNNTFDTSYSNSNLIKKHGALIYKSNILYKNNSNIVSDNLSYNENSSYWRNLKSYSLNYLLDNRATFTKKSIVLIGVSFQEKDYFTNAVNSKMYGVDILANAIKTVLFLDGKVERINLFLGFAIIFIIFFNVSFFTESYLPKIPSSLKTKIEIATYILIYLLAALTIGFIFNIFISIITIIIGWYLIHIAKKHYQKYIWFDFVAKFLILSVLMLSVSYYFLVEHKVWFNWFIPIIIFYLDDFIILLREYAKINKTTRGHQ